MRNSKCRVWARRGPVLLAMLGSSCGAGSYGSEGLSPVDMSPVAVVSAVPVALETADVNGAQNLDLITVNFGTNDVSVLLGNGLGLFGKAAQFAAGRFPSAVAIGDFNGDQKPDLAVTNEASHDISVLLDDERGGFGAATSFKVGTSPS